MSVLEELTHFPADFSGVVRLFPLPDLVLFPHVIQPLHVFEPRYRALLADSLADDRLIAMVRLHEGVQACRRPAIESVACVCRVVAHAPEADGRANVLLAGLRRVLLRQELAVETLYRQAKGDVLEDEYPADGAKTRRTTQRRLLREVQSVLKVRHAVRNQLSDILKAPIGLGALTDILAFSLPWETAFRQQLLEETNVDARAAALLEELAVLNAESSATLVETCSDFPPAFSEN